MEILWWLQAIGYWWVRAGSIEILELFVIDLINPPLRTRTGEYVGGDKGRSYLLLDLYGRVYANNHRQIPEIVNEPAQPHQQISIVIRSCVDDNVRSIGCGDRSLMTCDRLLVGEGGFD